MWGVMIGGYRLDVFQFSGFFVIHQGFIPSLHPPPSLPNKRHSDKERKKETEKKVSAEQNVL